MASGEFSTSLLSSLHHFRAHVDQADLGLTVWKVGYGASSSVNVVLSQRSCLLNAVALNDHVAGLVTVSIVLVGCYNTIDHLLHVAWLRELSADECPKLAIILPCEEERRSS
jgi:hypothetical protein